MIWFETNRLRVFVFKCEPTAYNQERIVYVAFENVDGCPKVLATMVLEPLGELSGYGFHVDWLEVSSVERLKGFGRELFLAVNERHDGELVYDGATDEGELFCDAMDRERRWCNDDNRRKT